MTSESTAVNPGPFAVLLKRFRADAGLTQEELAEKAQLSPKAVSSLERGIRRRPHRVTIALLAEALELGPDSRSDLERVARSETPISSVLAAPTGLPPGAFLGAAPGGRIIARHEEIEVLCDAIQGVEAGNGRTVLLAGEAGIGKTRLAQEIHVLLRERGFITSVGRCYEPRSSVSYFPFLEPFSALFEEAPRQLRDSAMDRWPFLRVLLPDRQEFGPIHTGSHGDQVLVFRAATSFLVALAQFHSVAVLIDDLHWADASSVQLFHHLARDSRSERVFLLATYRDTDASGQPALLDALRDLEREELVERVFVPPLGRAETKELMSDVLNGERDLPDELGEFVFRRAEGNPYFVRQLVGALQEGGFNGDALDTGSIGVPETIRSLVAQRMHRLSAATREALCEAAVLGQAFFLEDLLSMTNRDEAALENGMEEARLAGLVRENGTDGYSFDHGLTQQALYESLPARARRRLHIHAGHAIAALEEQERRGRLAELAWHFLQAGESAEAARWSLEAGDEAWSISALAEAEQHFRTAVRLSATMDDVAVRAHALQGMGSVLNVLGHYEEARASLEEADSLFELADNDVGRARIAAELGGLYFMAGRPEDGVACVENALGRLRLSDESDSSHRSQAELHAVLAQLLWPSGRRTEALVSTQQAGELAKKTGDRRTQGWAEMQEAFMLETLGRRHEALSRAQTALRDVESGTDDDLLWYSLSVLTHMYSIRGELPAALEMIQRSLAAADRRGDPQYRAASLGELARYRTLSGEWSQAEEALNEAASCVDADDPIIGFIEVVRGQLDLWRGDTKNLKGRLSRVVESSAATGNVDRQVSATLLLAEVEILAGRPEDAVIRLQGLANRSGFSEDEPGYGMCLALVLITLGRLDDAALIIEQLTTLAIEDALKLPLTDLSRLRALALAGHGRWDEAQTAAQESLALARAMSIPYKEGQALVVLGRTRMESRQISDGRAAFEEALTIFGRLGAAGEARQTESELRAISEPS